MIDTAVKYITIPMPRATQNLYRGLVGQSTVNTSPISVRWARSDKDFVDQQAAHIGLSFSEFVRWCAVFVAKEIEELQRKEDFKIKPTRKQKREIDMSEWE